MTFLKINIDVKKKKKGAQESINSCRYFNVVTSIFCEIVS